MLIDRRVAAEGVTPSDLERQLATAVAARDLLSRVRLLAKRAADLQKELSARVAATPSDAAKGALQRVAELERRLVADAVHYPTPQLVEQAEHLYRMTQISDQRLGQDVTERLAELEGLLERARTDLEAIWTATRGS